MRKLVIFLAFFVLLSCSARKYSKEKNIGDSNQSSIIKGNLNKGKSDLKSDSAKMDFGIKIPATAADKTNLIIHLTFKNKSDKTMRLLDMFDPVEIFFGLRIYTKEGKSFVPFLGGFIDFPYGTKLNYIDIKPNRSFVKELNLSNILKANKIELEQTKYNLEMSYFNYKGEDCIKGRFKSNAIELNITK